MKFDIEVKIMNTNYRIWQRLDSSVVNITSEKENDWIVISSTDEGKLRVHGKGWQEENP